MNPWSVKENKFPSKGSRIDKLKFILNYAILAPSGHNSQPWLFRIEENLIEVLADYSKRRETTDPSNRELLISLGCAIENIIVALKHFRISYKLELYNNNLENEPKAKFEIQWLKNSPAWKEGRGLLGAITKRSTNRNPYSKRVVEKKYLAEIMKLARQDKVEVIIIEDRKLINEVGDLVTEASREWFKNKRLVDELKKWIGHEDEGVSLKILDLDKISNDIDYFLDSDGVAAEEKAEKDRRLVIESSAIIVFASPDEPIGWLRAGMAYEAGALVMTKNKIQNSFFFSVMEIEKQRQKLRKLLNSDKMPQLLIRIGYGKEVRHTSRRPVEEVIISSR